MKKKDSKSGEVKDGKKGKEKNPKKKHKTRDGQKTSDTHNKTRDGQKTSGRHKAHDGQKTSGRDKTKNGKKKADIEALNGPKRSKTQNKIAAYHNTRHLFGANMSEQLEHGENVSSLAYEVGRELGLSDRECEDLIIAGFFHDIGKAQISNEAQGRDCMLVEEMNSVRQHPKAGYEILKRHGFSEEICREVLYHHENMDGSGYPESLEGANIPLGACILRVCDVFCALIQDRPYRNAFPPETAMKMMIEEVEKYNLKVFLAFQRVLHRSPDGSIALPEVRPEVRGVWKKL